MTQNSCRLPFFAQRPVAWAAFQEQQGTTGRVAVSEAKRQNNSYTPGRKFPTIEPKILYFGTPLALLSSLNEDRSTDLAPIRKNISRGCIENETAREAARNGAQLLSTAVRCASA